MWQLGHENWIKYGWGTKLSSVKETETTKFHMDFTSYEIPDNPYSPFEAAVDAVHKIVATYPAPYTLMCSGGVDSQSMILAWIESKVPFQIMTFRYISENTFFNDYDLSELDRLADIHGLTINYQDLDIVSFLENNLREYAEIAECASPHFCTHMKFADFVPSGTILYSGNTLSRKNASISYHTVLII